MQLKHSKEFTVKTTAHFNFDATFFKPDHFTTLHSKYIEGTRWQTFIWEGNFLGVRFNSSDRKPDEELVITVFSEQELAEEFYNSLITEIKYRFNLELDIQDFYGKYGSHEALKEPIQRLRGMRPGHPSSLYEYLVIGIILQNASIRRSTQMFENMVFNYGRELDFDGQKLWAMWEPEKLKDVEQQELRDLKMGYRARTILRLNEEFLEGKVNEMDLRKEEMEVQKDKLLSLFGVGPATVWYILFDVFHRWETFDHVSPWEQKLYSRLFFNRGLDDIASVEEILRFIDQFGEYKHLAVHYIWEDMWWRRENGEKIEWLENEIRK